MSVPPSLPEPRMTLVDGLRGLAALAVLAFHFCMAARLPHEHADWMPDPLEWLLEHGWLGVQLFFVLSGFVIAYSLRSRKVTASLGGRFFLRRSLRLDPPYWVVLALEVVLVALLGTAWDGKAASFDLGRIAAHLLYVQEFLHQQELVGVFWTLCVEVQLYVVFVLALGLAQRLSRTAGEPPRGRALFMFALPFALLLAGSLVWLASGQPGLPFALKWWYLFVLGALTWWTLDGTVPRWWLAVAAAPVAVLCAWVPSPEAAVALAAAGLLYVAGRAGRLTTWLAWRPLQHVGRISYSLYLLHLVVGRRLLGSVLAAYGRTPWSFVLGSILGLTASFLAAELLYRFVE